MKKNLLFTITMLLSVCLFAQTNEGQGAPQKKEVKRIRTADSGDRMHKKQEMQHDFAISGLTEEQRNSIRELRLAMAEEVGQHAKLLREKRVQLNTLQKAETPDQTAINSTIDEITALRGQMMKFRADFRTKVNALLNEEQRLAFQRSGMRENKRFRPNFGDGKVSNIRVLTGSFVDEDGKNIRIIHNGEEISDWKSLKSKKDVKTIRVTKEKGNEIQVHVETE